MQYSIIRGLICCIFLCWFGTMVSYGQISYQPAFPDLTFNFPVEIQNANDNSNRLFVVEQPGVIKVFPNSSQVTEEEVFTFLDIRSKVSYSSGQEIGLLGLAFHPNFSSNGFLYVYYTDFPGNYRINISRFQVSAENPNIVDPSTETIILQFEKNQNNSNHNGGKIAFGPEGYLYISVGDGGGANDPNNNAQNLDNLFGAILRIDVNNPEGENAYGIPEDNPLVGLVGRNELYAWGIRNTWKFSFDQGVLWGADVGQAQMDEINLIERGSNYGWRKYEGDLQGDFFESTTLATNPAVFPVYSYRHDSGDRSVTGGYVYRGSSDNPQLQGKYIFGDYISGRVWSLDYNANTGEANRAELFKTTGQFISSFGLDEAGEIYFSDYGNAVQLYRIIDEESGPDKIAVEGTGAWVNMGVPGSNGIVETILNKGSNEFLVGGEFSSVSGIPANNIAKYSKIGGWEAIGSGTNGRVKTINVDSQGNIYVGGSFSEIEGITVSNIAVWDGNTWSGLGLGTDGPVSQIGIDSNDNVFVGGSFQSAGGIQVNNIARWDGSWNALVDSNTLIPGTNNEIRAISFDENDELLVGGNFDSAGGISAPRIARWNGANWDTFGVGTSGFVQSILVHTNYIYAGGNFALAGGQTVNRVARWNRANSVWESLGYGVTGNVNTLAYDGAYLYVGGSFETASDELGENKITNNIARWSEENGWEALGTQTKVGVETVVNSIVFDIDESELFVGGAFGEAGEILAENTAVWRAGNGCTSSSISIEYDLQGATFSASSVLELATGDDIQLGIAESLYYTVTLPDTQKVIGDYSIVNIAPEDAGTYTFESTEGCKRTLEIIVSDLPGNNFSISSTGTSCQGVSDGRVRVEAFRPYSYTAQLIGDGINESFSFSDQLEFTDLPPGNYDLCISVAEFPDYELCSTVVIASPEPLSVISKINRKDKLLNLQLQGAEEYLITFNEDRFSTTSTEVELSLKKGMNLIKVRTAQDCQGSYEEKIIFGQSEIYPNPFENTFFVRSLDNEGEFISLKIYTLTGQLVSSNTFEVSQNEVEFNFPGLNQGIYLAVLRSNSFEETFKLVKL